MEGVEGVEGVEAREDCVGLVPVAEARGISPVETPHDAGSASTSVDQPNSDDVVDLLRVTSREGGSSQDVCTRKSTQPLFPAGNRQRRCQFAKLPDKRGEASPLRKPLPGVLAMPADGSIIGPGSDDRSGCRKSLDIDGG